MKRMICLALVAMCLLVSIQPVQSLAAEQSSFVGQQLYLGDDLCMHFYADIGAADAADGVMTVTVGGEVYGTYSVKDMAVNESGYYDFSVNLGAPEMTQSIFLVLISGGETVLQKQYSIREYAQYLLNGNYNDETKALVLQLLNYGAKAQLFFNYKTDALANAGNEIQSIYPISDQLPEIQITGSVDGIRYYGSAMVFRSKVAMRHYFQAAGNIAQYEISVNGNKKQPVSKDGLYYIEVADINPQDMDTAMTVSVTDGTDTQSFGYSPMNYIVRMYNKEDTAQALKNMLLAANGYFQAAKLFEDVTPPQPSCIHLNMEHIESKAATCTETGIAEHWYCPDCQKCYEDATAENILNSVVTEATGHSYSTVWSSDKQYHWHNAICEHTEEVIDKTAHTLNSQNICTICEHNMITLVQLQTPAVSAIKYDTIYWQPVENAEYYTVRINDNYECTLRGTSCAIEDAIWNDKTISKPGWLSVEIRANGYTSENADTIYASSQWSNKDDSYYYVPLSESEDAKTATRFKIGYGYNLVEDPYLDVRGCASTNSVLNVRKLLTVGEYSEGQGTSGETNGYYYTSVDDFLSKTRLGVEVGTETGCSLIGTIKTQINANVGFDYSSHKYTSTYIGESRVVYNDRRILNFRNEDLKHCLSDIFLQDVNRESNETKDMSDQQLAAYLYNEYGTHVILGVTTGGVYISQYTVATNDEAIAAEVAIAFKTSTTSGAIGKVIENNFNISADLKEKIESNQSNTEASFYTYFYGGNGSTINDMSDYKEVAGEWMVSDETATATGFTRDGAIAISFLLDSIDPALAEEFDKYIYDRSDATYGKIAAQYTIPSELTWDVTTENEQNILHINLSKYQKYGKLENVYSSYMLDNVMTIHPIMKGKQIHKIVISGDLSEYGTMIDKFSVALSDGWDRNVDVVIDNLGIISATEKGLVDTSAVAKDVDVNISYSGFNLIKKPSDENPFMYTTIDSKVCIHEISLSNYETLDFGSAKNEDGQLYLPVVQKPYYIFTGWYTSDGIQLTKDTGESLENANIATDITIYPHLIKEYSDYTYIYTVEDFEAITEDGKYMLAMDLDFGNKVYNDAVVPVFNGEFWGNNHNIKNLKIELPSDEKITSAKNTGLFGFLMEDSNVYDFNVYNFSIFMDANHLGEKGVRAGSVAGRTTGTISQVNAYHCSIEIHRQIASYGGIVGNCDGLLYDCTVDDLTLYGNGDTGGIAGVLTGTITNCKVTNSLIKQWPYVHARTVGGVVGYIENGHLSACDVTDTVFEMCWEKQETQKVYPWVGVIVGWLDGGSIADVDTRGCSWKCTDSWFLDNGYGEYCFSVGWGYAGCITDEGVADVGECTERIKYAS